MRIRRTIPARLIAVAAGATFCLSSMAYADEADYSTFPSGAPEEGVDVPLRMQNPGDSRQFLEPSQRGREDSSGERQERPSQERDRSDNPYRRLLEQRRPAEGADGEAGEEGAADGERRRLPAGMGHGASQRDQTIRALDIAYSGITPGQRDEVEHIRRQDDVITWLGFQARDDRTRVFVQTGSRTRHEVIDEGSTIRIRLAGTRIEDRNLRRPVDTEYFARSVQSIRASDRGSQGSEIIIERRGQSEFTVERDGNYLYIDFMDVN